MKEFVFGAVALVAAMVRAEDPNKYILVDIVPNAEAVGRALQATDVYDRLAASADTPKRASDLKDSTTDFTLPDGTPCAADPMRVEVGDVLFPQLGVTKQAPYFVIPQPNYYDGSGTKYIRHQKIVFPSSMVDASADEELSLVMRFKWDGSAAFDGNYLFRLVGYGYTWATGQGVDFALGARGSSTQGCPGFIFGNDSYRYFRTNDGATQTIFINSNTWVDVAWTIKRLGEAENGKCNYECHAYVTDRSQNQGILQESAMTKTLPKMTPVASNGIKLSSQDQGALATVAAAGPNGCRDFRGRIQRLTFYKRALTRDEVIQAMAGDSHDVVLGVENGKADEFGDAGAADVFDADAMPERKLRKTISLEKPLVIQKNLPTNSCQMARYLQFTVLPSADIPTEGRRAYLKISVNDRKIGHVRLEPEGKAYYVCCPAQVMSEAVAIKDGVAPVTVKLERVGGESGTVAIDRLAFGGAWMVGVKNDANTEFGGASEYWKWYYHLAAGTAKACAAALYNSQDNMINQRIYFTLTKEEAENLQLKLTFRGCTTGNWKLQVNDVDYDTSKYAYDPTTTKVFWRFLDYSWTFPKGTFHEGLNWINRVQQTEMTGVWDNNDYFKLETVEAYPCSLHTGPLGISGMMMLLR